MMTSRERLLAVCRGEMPDRVPISTYELVGWDQRNFCNLEPSYHGLMEYIRQKTDCIAMWDPASDQKLLCSAYDAHPETQKIELPDGYENVTRYRVGNRDLVTRTRFINGIYTSWKTEPLCKDSKDVDALMSLPFVPVTFDSSDAGRIWNELGDRGILMPSLADPAYLAMELMEFGESMVWVMSETEYFESVVKELHRRNMINLKTMLETTDADLYRICGPEYMCPPYLPPKYFERFMLPYLTDMVQLIHQYNRLVRVHCHGRIGRVIDMIVETGCDGTDPCEEIPDGDTTLEELKARVGDKLTLFGSMQLKLLETGCVEDVRRETARMLAAGKPNGRFVLMPTAAPINVPLRDKTVENYKAYIDTALACAAY